MNERWRQLEALFEQAIEIPAAERDAWLAAQDVDDDVKREVAAMVALDDSAPGRGLTKKFGDAIVSAAEIPMPGQKVGRYRLKRELGSGGAGIVFLAERADGEFSQDVAIKVIRGVATGDAVKQLRHERQVLAGFQHPGIARLYDGGETERGQPYLVMEYIEGAQPITEACQKRGIDLRERLKLVREVALAVHYAHQRLVIHRDIKPANVLLRADGRPVLLDFGISKLLDANVTQALQTQQWFTPAYAAPEQRRGAAVSTATDVYALGLLLYELVADQRAQVAPDGSMKPPSAVVPTARRAALRGDVDRIVAFATAYEPSDRYPSADSFARDIERYLAGLPVRAAPDVPLYRMRKFVRRHPAGVAAAIGIAAVLALFTWRLADERDRAVTAERLAQRESQASQAVTSFLMDLFREAEPAVARRTLSPAELIDRGVARLKQADAIQGDARARLLGTLGTIYQNMGLPNQGSQALVEAVAYARASGERDVLAQALFSLGLALDERGQFDDAVRAFEEARALFDASDDELRRIETQAHEGLALAHVGRYAEAERLLLATRDEAARIEGPDSPLAGKAIVYLSEVLRETDRDLEARGLLEEALPRLERALGADSTTILEFYGYYANLLLQLEENDLAQRIFERVLTSRQEIMDPTSSSMGFVHNGLGMLYYQQGRTREAAEQMSLALAIGERTLDPMDPSLAIDLNNVGSIYEEMGDYARGEPFLRRAMQIMEKSAADRRALYAQYRQNLGRLLMFAGKADEARALLEAPIDGSEGEGFTLQRARQAFHLAEWHRRYGDPDDAERYLDAVEAQVEGLGGYESPRYGQVLRTRALLATARGEHALARTDLERARTLLVNARGEHYMGVAEIDLDLAELDLAEGDGASARTRLARARPVIESIAAEQAPQRERLRAIEHKLAA